MLLIVFSIVFLYAQARSLTDVVCQINPAKCDHFKEQMIGIVPASGSTNDWTAPRVFSTPKIDSSRASASPYGAPSLDEFRRWNNYEESELGAPRSGNNGVPFGPGLGDIGITSGIGIQHPFGGLGIERDFGLSMGGSGRIGGMPVGWGNGAPRTIGSAPFLYP
ncbi:unnamed protein product [Caenorhabditis auriculariae]|uniref:Uncharacterized protein n=1 Tax=Caenorhabditis auriculariae TaxID=2777116 RepID=A0A8S1HBA7_9PELO|nr:unnamed protein product [Caenorhabditis auriculariae]